MRRFLLFILFASEIVISASGQQPSENDPQKLLQLIQKDKPDTNYVKRLLELSNYYLKNRRAENTGPDSAFLFAGRAETVSLQLKYAKGLGDTYIALSGVYNKAKHKEQAKEYVNKAIHVFANAGLLTNLGYAYWELSGYYDLSPAEFPQKISFIEKSVYSFHDAGNVKKEADALKELADVRQINGDLVHALTELKQALNLYQSINEPVLHGIYDLMGNVSCLLGNLHEAVRYGLLAVQTAEKLKDSSLQLCTIYNRLGMTYFYLNDYESSSVYYKKAISVAEKYHAHNDISVIAHNYANNLIHMNKPAESNAHLQAMLKKYPNMDTGYLTLYICCFIKNYTTLKQFSQAEKYFNQLNSIIKGRDLNFDIQRNAYITQVSYLLASGQNEKARVYLKAEEEFFSKNSSAIHLSVNQLSWAMLDSATGDYRSAFKHFRKYVTLRDSIYTNEKSKFIALLNVQYEIAKKDQDILLKAKNIELLEQKSIIQHAELSRANQTRNWIMGLSFLLLIIIGLLINHSRQKQRTNKQLQTQQNEIEKKNATLQFLVTEKEWLVKEIHHRVKNNFHIVMGLLGTQSEYLESKEAIQAIQESHHRVQAMSLVHQKLYQSDNLSAINMADYIHELVDYLKSSFNKRKKIQFILQIEPIELGLSHCIPLGLILNEAIANAIKYAFPGNREGIINIVFKRISHDQLQLTVSDNGVGLPEGFAIDTPASMGMRLMTGLSEDIDATLTISSVSGTAIHISFMYDHTTARNYNSLTVDLNSI